MFTGKCLAVLLLVVATNFSQSLAAPSQGNTDLEDAGYGDDAEFWTQPTAGDTVTKMSDDDESWTQSTTSTPLQGSSVEESYQEEVAEPSVAAEITTGVPQQLLTKEEELEILKNIPDFAIIMQSMEELPANVYHEIREFLQQTVPRMPPHNLVTVHFKNAQVLTQLFDRVVRVAIAHGQDDPDVRRELFAKVHQAVPNIKSEMEDVNEFVGNVRAQLPSFSTLANPTKVTAENYDADVQLLANADENRHNETPRGGPSIVPAAEK